VRERLGYTLGYTQARDRAARPPSSRQPFRLILQRHIRVAHLGSGVRSGKRSPRSYLETQRPTGHVSLQ